MAVVARDALEPVRLGLHRMQRMLANRRLWTSLAEAAGATTVTSATVVVEAPGMNLAIRKTTRAPASSHSSGEKARRLPTLLIRCPARAG